MTDKPRRPRRIAADEAHAWARNLRLGNSLAKLTLSMVTGYVNGEGVCFVGIESLAEDTELSTDTVRKRLAWLEQVGAIARFPQWIDANGRRNGEGTGKRTSDEIRLLISADPEDIEARAKGGGEDVSSEETSVVSPSLQQGVNPVGPPVALGQPSDSSKGLTSEPEPEEIPPTPPSGGDRTHDLSENFKPFAGAYPAPITDMGKALAIWSALSEAERTQAIVGAKGYRSYIETERQSRRNRAVKDAHRWLRDRLWLGYLTAGQQAEATGRRFDARQGSDQWLAWMVFYRICGEAEGIPKFLITGPPGNRVASVPREWPPVGQGVVDPNVVWQTVEDGSGQFAAWVRRLRELPGVKIQLRSNIVDGRSIRFLRVPSEWPPNKGTTGPPPTTITSEDREFIDKQGLG